MGAARIALILCLGLAVAASCSEDEPPADDDTEADDDDTEPDEQQAERRRFRGDRPIGLAPGGLPACPAGYPSATHPNRATIGSRRLEERRRRMTEGEGHIHEQRS